MGKWNKLEAGFGTWGGWRGAGRGHGGKGNGVWSWRGGGRHLHCGTQQETRESVSWFEWKLQAHWDAAPEEHSLCMYRYILIRAKQKTGHGALIKQLPRLL